MFYLNVQIGERIGESYEMILSDQNIELALGYGICYDNLGFQS